MGEGLRERHGVQTQIIQRRMTKKHTALQAISAAYEVLQTLRIDASEDHKTLRIKQFLGAAIEALSAKEQPKTTKGKD